VLINHSQIHDLEVYHGRPIYLDECDDRLPFHDAFLFHEMRVRGYWPHRADRAIPLPIPGVQWLDDGDGRNHGGRGRGGRGGSNDENGGGHHLRSHGPVPGSSASGRMFIPKNPFTNPAALKGLKEFLQNNPIGKLRL